MGFPQTRLRRLRRTEALRRLVRETSVDPSNLIYPLFVCPGEGVRRPVSSMPGVFNFSIDEALREVEEAASLDLGGLILFGIPETKDEEGSSAWDDNRIVQQALRALKQSAAAKKVVLISDVCLDEYTCHGHCGIVVKMGDGFDIDNDRTIQVLGRIAVSHARAGADIVAPSDMMDGRVAAIRFALDSADFKDVPVLSCAAKFASVFQTRKMTTETLPRSSASALPYISTFNVFERVLPNIILSLSGASEMEFRRRIYRTGRTRLTTEQQTTQSRVEGAKWNAGPRMNWNDTSRAFADLRQVAA